MGVCTREIGSEESRTELEKWHFQMAQPRRDNLNITYIKDLKMPFQLLKMIYSDQLKQALISSRQQCIKI